MAADAVIDVDRGVISRFQEGLRGLSDDELAVMARQSPAVHFAACVRIQNKDNEPIQPVPNILQLRMSEVYEVCMEPGLPSQSHFDPATGTAEIEGGGSFSDESGFGPRVSRLAGERSDKAKEADAAGLWRPFRMRVWRLAVQGGWPRRILPGKKVPKKKLARRSVLR